jgi:hypothetical protein
MTLPRLLDLAVLALLAVLTLVNQPAGESFGRGLNVVVGFLVSAACCLALAAVWLGAFLWSWGRAGWSRPAFRTASGALLWSLANLAWIGVLFALIRLFCTG